MTNRPPAVIASAAAEEVRALNHALYGGFSEPADAYSTVGNLAHLASMLPQALSMIREEVEKLERGGQLRSDRSSLADDLFRAYEGLRVAAPFAQALYESLQAAQKALSHLGTRWDAQDGEQA